MCSFTDILHRSCTDHSVLAFDLDLLSPLLPLLDLPEHRSQERSSQRTFYGSGLFASQE